MARAKKDHFICSLCNQELHKDFKVTRNRKAICKNCADKLDKEKLEHQDFLRYLTEELDLNNINGMIISQIKNYRENYNYLYSGMKYTIYYCKEILKMDFDIDKFGIGFIPYNYKKAEEYFLEQQALESSVPSKINVEYRRVKRVKTISEEKPRLYDLNKLIGGQ